MTLSIMEDHDTFKTALKDYQNAMGDIPKILERYLGYVARTGKPLFSWDMISCLILKKFQNVCDCYAGDKIPPSVRISGDGGSTEELKLECLKSLNEFSGVPFTIQRICELLLTPRQNYSKLDKFLRGFIRVIKVVTTVDRVGQRITTESQSLANAMSPFPMNESGDNWASFSNHSDESVCTATSISPTSDITCNSEIKCDLDYEEKSLDDTMCTMPDSITPYLTSSATASAIINNSIQQSQSIAKSLYSNESFFLEQKTISMPPIGALFKPIDQLEAFVQNVSSQVESSNDCAEVSKKRAADDTGLLGESCDMLSYVSPAKKSRLSIDVGDNDEETEQELKEAVTTSSDIVEQCSEVGNSADKVVPSRSCETMAEEASSTNDGDEGHSNADNGGEALLTEVSEESPLSSCTSSKSGGVSDDGILGAVAGVEPDQSNFDNVGEQPVETEKTVDCEDTDGCA